MLYVKLFSNNAKHQFWDADNVAIRKAPDEKHRFI